MRFPIIARMGLVAACLFAHRAVADEPIAPPPPPSNTAPAPLAFEVDSLTLVGSDARAQLQVRSLQDGGVVQDVSRDVTYIAEPIGVVAVDALGQVQPLADGHATITATDAAGHRTTARVDVVQWQADPPINFHNQVVPLFTKFGCNGGGCHGKAAGQNGFKLSLLGFEPDEDYGHLVKESRGRRVSPAAPDESLLLTKAINATPHGGGQRLEKDSAEYRILRRWIAQGMPLGKADEAVVQSIEVLPPARRMQPTSQQQLVVMANYSNGARQDVTRMVQFDTNDTTMASVDARGLVATKDLTGEVAIMARFQGHVATFRASVPLPPLEYAWPTSDNVVDAAIQSQLRSLNIPPSDACDDQTFIRRASLDIAGQLPTPQRTVAFLQDTALDKRSKYIDELLDSDAYAEHFASRWMLILRNRRQSPGQQSGSFALSRWLQQQLRENRPYSEWVRDIVAASGELDDHPPVAWYRNVTDGFQRIEDSAQLFLGQRIQCARCHHHPHEKWSQTDYFRYAAFFSLVRNKPGLTPDEPVIYTSLGKPRSSHPKTGQTLEPAALDGPIVDPPDYRDPRQDLVDWMVQSDNPYFARALVNRYWKHFLGRGLVEPEDDLRITNPASNPELLDALADAFKASNYDLKQLIRLICRSAAYQRSAVPNGINLRDQKCYSRYYPKRLSAEVLADAVDRVTHTSTDYGIVPPTTPAVALPDAGFSSYFLSVFGRPEASTACSCERANETNLAQSLHLFNSKQVQAKLAEPRGMAASLAADTRPVDQRLDELFLTALSRWPTSDQRQALVNYLSVKGSDAARFEDIVWTMLNSQEFLFNH